MSVVWIARCPKCGSEERRKVEPLGLSFCRLPLSQCDYNPAIPFVRYEMTESVVWERRVIERGGRTVVRLTKAQAKTLRDAGHDDIVRVVRRSLRRVKP